MSLYFRYNEPVDGPGGSGRRDALRLISGTGPVANDLDPRVLFSSNFLSAQVVAVTIPVNVNGAADFAVSNTWVPSRSYGAMPRIEGAFVMNNGEVVMPYYENLTNTPLGSTNSTPVLQGLELFQLSCKKNADNTYTVTWYLQQTYSRKFQSGNLKIFAIGKGI